MRWLGPVQRKSLETATSLYETHREKIRSYLTDRGIREDTAEHFRLGCVAEPMRGHEVFAGRLVIPYLTASGPVDLKFRCLEPHDCKTKKCPKYLTGDGGGGWLFNACTLLDADPATPVLLTEGEIDAITVEQAGWYCVGYPGATSWTARENEHWRRVLAGRHVVHIEDGDQAGTEAGRAVARALDGHVRSLRRSRMPDGHDANSFIGKFGAGAFADLLGVQ